jgi:hypothetical protein
VFKSYIPKLNPALLHRYTAFLSLCEPGPGAAPRGYEGVYGALLRTLHLTPAALPLPEVEALCR